MEYMLEISKALNVSVIDHPSNIENEDFFDARETVRVVEDQNSKSSQAADAARLGQEGAVSQ